MCGRTHGPALGDNKQQIPFPVQSIIRCNHEHHHQIIENHQNGIPKKKPRSKRHEQMAKKRCTERGALAVVNRKKKPSEEEETKKKTWPSHRHCMMQADPFADLSTPSESFWKP